MFFIAFTLACILIVVGLLIGSGCQRVADHLRDKPEATRIVVEHVLMPLFGHNEIADSAIPVRHTVDAGSGRDRS